MTVLDSAPDPVDLLTVVDQQVRDLQDAGGEPHAILVGPEAYEALKTAVAERFGREPADLSQYQWVPVVVDPFRGDRVCVVPAPRDVAAGVRAERA
ncbi:family 4C encapsulin nanocompartment shell protein [Rubrivirga sp.]|uniref:family 4C encapsulin nanocompartment shell protein n=1 Tax=Rubrivirga sp. TaxID=1885344 RepID=UPI003B52784A